MQNNEYLEGLAYSSDAPNIKVISEAYKRDLASHSGYADQVADAYNQRRMYWPGKSIDQRKHALDAKPWRFASDLEVPVIDPRINTLTALCMNAIKSGQIVATPIGGEDAETSGVESKFIRWMMDTWVPNSYDQIELALSNMFEKGIAVAWVGWEKCRRAHKEEIDIEVLAQQSPELVEILLDEERVDEAIDMFEQSFDGVNRKAAKKALRKLRKDGVAEIPVIREDINRPTLVAKCPRADVIFPQYTMDVRDADRVHVRHFMSIQDIRAAVFTEGWSKEWADEIVERHMGMTQQELDGPYGNRDASQANQSATLFNLGSRDADDLVEIVETYTRQIDEDDGAVGYYRTLWCPKQADFRYDDDISYGLHELLSGWDEFPIALKTLTRDSKRIYDQRNVCDLLRGNQFIQKVVRDAFVDQQSIAMNPPRTHPAGRPPNPWGAGVDLATRRGEEGLYRTLDIPDTSSEGMRFAEKMDQEADFIMGLDANNPMAVQRQQYFVNRALDFLSDCARLLYKAYHRFYDGPDIHFRITNVPETQVASKELLGTQMDIKIGFDVRNLDSEHVRESVKSIMELANSDQNGDLDRSEAMRIAAFMTIPQYADRLLRPKEEAASEIQKKVAEDLTLIWGGNTVNAQPSGANIALQYIQQYAQQQNIQQRLQTDPEYANAFNAYVQQYQFQIQQQQNAVTGRLGTPAQDINT